MILPKKQLSIEESFWGFGGFLLKQLLFNYLITHILIPLTKDVIKNFIQRVNIQ